MSYLFDALKKKEEELLQLVEKTKGAVKELPEGRLKICSARGYAQYYRVVGDKKIYIKRNDVELVRKMAQNEYDYRVYVEAMREVERVRELLKNYRPGELVRMYDSMNEKRRELVTPHIMTEEEYVRQWKEQEYEQKEFREGMPEIYSNRGERVRSKSEKIIADMLDREGVPYKYECPLHLQGMGKIYPDFTLLDQRERKEIYYEHLGMMDVEDYMEKALQRIECYEKNGFLLGKQLIVTYETRKRPLRTQSVERIIQKVIRE